MKLSSKGRYGVRAVFDVALRHDGRAAQVKDIAERQGIPPRFLEHIFQDLKRAGIVSSKRGPRGGYQLVRPPAEIKLGDVVRAVEGPIDLASSDADASAPSDAPSVAVTEDAFRDLAAKIEACLDAITLQDLLERAHSAGLHARRNGKHHYVI